MPFEKEKSKSVPQPAKNKHIQVLTPAPGLEPCVRVTTGLTFWVDSVL